MLLLWSVSLFAGDHNMDYKPGWPLLRVSSATVQQTKHGARSMSVVKWIMNLPSRSPHHTPPIPCSTIKENLLEIELSGSEDEIYERTSSSPMQYQLEKSLEILMKTYPSDCQWFSYKVLKAATAQFSSGF